MKCKLTYQKLLKMGQDADWAFNMYMDLGLYSEAMRYHNIGQRILDAMLRRVIGTGRISTNYELQEEINNA